MSKPDEQRFDVELFIIRLSIEPAAITAALGLEPKIVHRFVDHRRTPKGALLKGNYPDTRWRHSVRHTVKDQWFVAEITNFVDSLMDHKTFLRQVRSTGGKTCVLIQFLGDG